MSEFAGISAGVSRRVRELEGFRKRLAADATPDREGLTEALREPDAGEQIRLFEGGDAAGLAAARSPGLTQAF